MELPKLLHNRVGLPHGRVFQGFVPGNTGISKAAELLGDLHSNSSLIDSSGSVHVGQSAVIGAMADQAVSDPHQRAANAPIRLADDGTAIIVGLVALVS
jgi:hypothetical protein